MLSHEAGNYQLQSSIITLVEEKEESKLHGSIEYTHLLAFCSFSYYLHRRFRDDPDPETRSAPPLLPAP